MRPARSQPRSRHALPYTTLLQEVALQPAKLALAVILFIAVIPIMYINIRNLRRQGIGQ